MNSSSDPNFTGENLSPGQSVGGGRYTLQSLLDAPAAHWLAQDEIECRPVTLKFLPTELCQDQRAMDELRNAIERLAQSPHPGLAAILELYEAPGLPAFIAAEHVEGHSLAALRSEQ